MTEDETPWTEREEMLVGLVADAILLSDFAANPREYQLMFGEKFGFVAAASGIPSERVKEIGKRGFRLANQMKRGPSND